MISDKDKAIIEAWLKDNDLIIASEPEGDIFRGDEIENNLMYTVTNIPDPNVGIFQYAYSPSFRTEEEAYDWCKAIMELCGKWKEYEQLYEARK